jgi:hypothetical protein
MTRVYQAAAASGAPPQAGHEMPRGANAGAQPEPEKRDVDDLD